MNNIFVYGTLRRGEHNNRLLSGAKFKGFYETEPIYVLRNLGSFPGLMLNGEIKPILAGKLIVSLVSGSYAYVLPVISKL